MLRRISYGQNRNSSDMRWGSPKNILDNSKMEERTLTGCALVALFLGNGGMVNDNIIIV